MPTAEFDMSNASKVLVLDGEDRVACIEAFQETFGITVPPLDSQHQVATSHERDFVQVGSRDIPSYIARGFGDVGLTGSIACAERATLASSLRYQTIEGALGTFELLLPEERAEELSMRLGNADAEPLVVGTSYPAFLGQCLRKAKAAGTPLNVAISPFRPSGSVEALPHLGISDAVASVVRTNPHPGFVGERLADISPAVIWRDPTKVPNLPEILVDPESLFGIDVILRERVGQIDDPSISSYTLERLRDPNQAVKKYGEEGAEFLTAVVGSESLESCEGELADLIYAAMVVANAKGVRVTLREVVATLADRNQSSSLWTQ